MDDLITSAPPQKVDIGPEPFKSEAARLDDMRMKKEKMAKRLTKTVEDMESGKFVGYNPLSLLPGFARTANYISADPDQSSTIYKRFKQLSARNLLFLEGRVAALQAEQLRLDLEDAVEGTYGDESFDILHSASSWEDFAVGGYEILCRESNTVPMVPVYLLDRWKKRKEEVRKEEIEAKPKEPQKARPSMEMEHRWQVAVATQKALEEYQEALLRYSKILELEHPARRNQEAMINWLKGDRDQNPPWPAQFLSYGAMSQVYHEPDDLISLSPPGKDDRLSRFISHHMLWFLWYFRKDSDKLRSDRYTRYIPEESVRYLANYINLFMAMAFLLAAVWGLWGEGVFVKKLAILTGFVAAFAFYLVILTTASRVELFGAVAAYAAVLVVYTGSGSDCTRLCTS